MRLKQKVIAITFLDDLIHNVRLEKRVIYNASGQDYVRVMGNRRKLLEWYPGMSETVRFYTIKVKTIGRV